AGHKQLSIQSNSLKCEYVNYRTGDRWMWMKLICLVIMFMAIPGIKGEIPLAYTPAAISGGQNDVLTVKNYDTGAVMTESYTDVEHLNRDTQVRTGAYANSADAASPRGGLEASISSNVIGNAHIAGSPSTPASPQKAAILSSAAALRI
ncbi:MAG TPA: hypothetical protein PKX20_07360, partial [Methanothrix soehngenii]|nr:hypothetical protein [Methanothrix soehngenii]